MGNLLNVRKNLYMAQVKERLPDSSAYKTDRHFKTLLPFTGLNRFSKSLTFDINMVALAGIVEGAGKLTSAQALAKLIEERAPAQVNLVSGYSEQFSTRWLLSEVKKISKMESIFQQQALAALPEFVARYCEAYPEGAAHVNDSFANLVLIFAKKQDWLSHYVTAKRMDCTEKHKKTFENLDQKKQQKVVASIETSLEKELSKLEKEQPLVFRMLGHEATEINERLDMMKDACGSLQPKMEMPIPGCD